MAKGNSQDKLKYVRAPRVGLYLETETGGAIPKKELPFVLAVLGNFSGKGRRDQTFAVENKPLEERQFAEIDRDTFDKVMHRIAPEARFQVADRRPGREGKKISVNLSFNDLKAFSPDRVAQAVPETAAILAMRQTLVDLKAKAQKRNVKQELRALFRDREKVQALLACAPSAQDEDDTSSA